MKLIAGVGMPNSSNSSNRYFCEIDGNALLKSKSTVQPVFLYSAVSMLARPMSKRFCRMDLDLRKPCCWGEIHELMVSSHLSLAALAINLLSVFTMLRGLVVSSVKMLP